MHLGAKIKDLKMAKEMWDIVKADATTKSMLYLQDTEDQLASMKLNDNDDPKTHLTAQRAFPADDSAPKQPN